MSGFRFKQFEISQDRCAMKVGTDGVLLGAWALENMVKDADATDDVIEEARCCHILDVGTGTGLIALMLAQRFPYAQVVGIDIDEEACEEAHENVANSPFADRVKILHCRLQDFDLASLDYGVEELGLTSVDNQGNVMVPRKFDAIVSNPPFFVNSLKNPDNKRTLARHTDSLPFRELWEGVIRLLAENGTFSVILPAEVKDDFAAEGCMLGFYLVRQCAVKTVPRKQPKRYLMTFSRHRQEDFENTVETMMDAEGNRSDWYAKKTDEFYC